jgi:hypothetical protein
MNISKIAQKYIGIGLVLTFLVGCAPATEAPTSIPTFPLPLQPSPHIPSPPIPSQPVQPTQSSLFKFIQTIQVTPDMNYSGAFVGFVRINFVPATDRFIVTFAARLPQPTGGCNEAAYVYKEYTTDMQEIGKTGILTCENGDSGSVMVENDYYFVTGIEPSSSNGLHLLKFDAKNWSKSAEAFIPLGLKEKYITGDPMIAYVNGQFDISSQYNASGVWPEGGAATFHEFLSNDLQLLDEKILSDNPHINGMSMIFVDKVYYLITADAYDGNVVVMRYDQDWNYLGTKTLIQQANFSTGLAFDGQRFYLAYLDTSQRTEPGFLPVFLNVHLAAFTLNWDLIEDLAVTNYLPAVMQTGRPWVILHGNRLYVSYDVDPIDPITQAEQLQSQAIVSIYELTDRP